MRAFSRPALATRVARTRPRPSARYPNTQLNNNRSDNNDRENFRRRKQSPQDFVQHADDAHSQRRYGKEDALEATRYIRKAGAVAGPMAAAKLAYEASMGRPSDYHCAAAIRCFFVLDSAAEMRKNASEAVKVFRDMRKSGGAKPGFRTLNALLTGVKSVKDDRSMAAAVEQFRECDKEGGYCDSASFTLAMSLLTHLHRPAHALRLFQDLCSRSGVAAAIAAAKANRRASDYDDNFDEGEEYSGFLGKISASARKTGGRKTGGEMNRMFLGGHTQTAHLSATAENDSTEVLGGDGQFANEDGIVPNAFTYTAAISACIPLGDVVRALALLSDLEDHLGPEAPMLASYNAAATACIKAGDYHHANTIFDTIRERGIPFDMRTYAAAIEAAPDVASAYRLYDECMAANFRPDAFPHVALFNRLGRAGEHAEAERAIDEGLAFAGLAPSKAVFIAKMKARSAAHDPAGVNAIRAEAATAKVRLNEPHAESLVLKAYGGAWEQALQHFETQRDKGAFSAAATTRLLFNVCLQVLRENGRTVEMQRIFDETDESFRDKVTYRTMLASLVERGDAAKTFEFVELMQKKNAPISAGEWVIIVTHMCENESLDHAFQVLQWMRERGVIPHAKTQKLLLELCIRQSPDGVSSILSQMSDNAIELSAAQVTDLMQQITRPDVGLQLIEFYRNSGGTDAAPYALLTSLCWKSGTPKDIERASQYQQARDEFERSQEANVG